MDNTVTNDVADAAMTDPGLSFDAAMALVRALAGLDPITGEVPPVTLPKRMDRRGWQRGPLSRVETGRCGLGWFWRCPRKSCSVWGGPFPFESIAQDHGRLHHNTHPRRTR